MFKVEEHKIGKFDTARLINALTGEYLEILAGFGAGLNDMVVKNADDELVAVIDGYRLEEEINLDHETSFKGSKLSPFPNRIYEGKYTFDGINYQLPTNEVNANNSLHAILHCKPFEVDEMVADEQSASVRLSYTYKGNTEGYPFPYHIVLTYVFNEEGVEVNTRITNLSDGDIPMGDGWHPYFKFENVDAVHLQMGAARRVSSNFGNKLTNQHGFEHYQSMAAVNLDDCFEVMNGKCFSVKLRDLTSQIEIEIWQDSEDKKYKYFQVYTPPSRRSIAVEPVTCVPDAFNNGKGLIILKPNEMVSMSFGIKNLLLNK